MKKRVTSVGLILLVLLVSGCIEEISDSSAQTYDSEIIVIYSNMSKEQCDFMDKQYKYDTDLDNVLYIDYAYNEDKECEDYSKSAGECIDIDAGSGFWGTCVMGADKAEDSNVVLLEEVKSFNY